MSPVTIERMTAMSYTISERCGNSSLNSMPHCPRGANFHGLPNTLLLASAAFAAPADPPQLGKNPTKDVVAAMTTDEKLSLVVGTGMAMPGLNLPADMQGPVVGETLDGVPGAAAVKINREIEPFAKGAMPALLSEVKERALKLGLAEDAGDQIGEGSGNKIHKTKSTPD